MGLFFVPLFSDALCKPEQTGMHLAYMAPLRLYLLWDISA